MIWVISGIFEQFSRSLHVFQHFISRIWTKSRDRGRFSVSCSGLRDSMPHDSLIRPFIIANRAEVKRMFITEYDEAATMEKFKKEYLSQGDRQRMESAARGMYAEGLTPDVIARVLKTTVEDIEVILGLNKA